MSSARCFKNGCIRELYGRCDCEGVVLFCKKHVSKHVIKPTSKSHSWVELYFKPAEEIKIPLINQLTELKKDINTCRVDAITKVNEIIKKLNSGFGNYINQINEIEARCNKMIKILQSGEKVLDIATENDIENMFKLSAADIKQKMTKWDINESYLNCEEINAAITSIFKIPFNSFMHDREDTICSNELSFFRHNSKNFASIDLNTLQISSTTTLPIQENIWASTPSCILPDKTYFYCCNNNSSSGYTFTIDKDKNVKQLQSSKLNYFVDPIFYNNFIYLIGGEKKLAERYSFKWNIWENMASITQDLDFDASRNVLYKDLILITGRHMKKILIYNISQNNYQEVQNLVLSANRYKFMLQGNNRVYVFEKSGRTFESAENNISSWTQIANNNITIHFNQSSVVLYKGGLYFVNWPNELWKFDLSSKQASKVAEF